MATLADSPQPASSPRGVLAAVRAVLEAAGLASPPTPASSSSAVPVLCGLPSPCAESGTEPSLSKRQRLVYQPWESRDPKLDRLWERLEGSCAGSEDSWEAVSAFSTWLLCHRSGRLTSLCDQILVQRLVPRVVAIAEASSVERLGKLVDFVDALMQANYLQDGVLSDDLVAFAVRFANLGVGRLPQGTQEEEQTLIVLAVCFSYGMSGARMSLILCHLDVMSYIRGWLDVLGDFMEGTLIEHKVALMSISAVICDSPEFTVEQLAFLVVPAAVWGMNGNRPFHDDYEPAVKLLAKSVSVCQSLESKMLMARAGLFACAWAGLCAENILAWCVVSWFYPQNKTQESEQLREVLVRETRSLQFCIDTITSFDTSSKFLTTVLTHEDALKPFDRHGYIDISLTEEDSGALRAPLFDRALFLRDLLSTYIMPGFTEIPPPMELFCDALNQSFHCHLRNALNLKGALFRELMPLGAFRFLLNEYAFVLSFENKCMYLAVFLRLLRSLAQDSEALSLVVRRDAVCHDVCRGFGLPHREPGTEAAPPAGALRGLLKVEFAEESGVDQGGLRREWFQLATSEFVRSDLLQVPGENAVHLGEAPPEPHLRNLGGRHWQPSPASVCSAVQNDWRDQFVFFGSILGFAMMYGDQLPIKFTRPFLKLLVTGCSVCHGMPIDGRRRRRSKVAPDLSSSAIADLLSVIEEMDSVLASKLRHLDSFEYSIFAAETLQEALEAAGLPTTFVASDSRCEELIDQIELGHAGALRRVEEESLREYIWRLGQHRLCGSIQEQARLMRLGLLRVICPSVLNANGEVQDTRGDMAVLLDQVMPDTESPRALCQAEVWLLLRHVFTLAEFGLLVSGEPMLDLAAWRRCARYCGYTEESPQVHWFWEVVETLSSSEVAALLVFTRGSSALPPTGFNALTFVIQKVSTDDSHLPEAHTCAFTLDLPEYSSKALLQEKLKQSMEEGTGFGRA